MIQIKDTIVSLDLIEEFFCCDIDACHGDCCVEGVAGAPLSEKELETIKHILPQVKDFLSPAGLSVINEEGPAYLDPDGDLVTALIDGAACAFTGFGPDGRCYCALEKACEAGCSDFRKPASCALYPVRIKKYPSFTAVNLHKWKICKPAFALGRKLNLRAYQFLQGPLTDFFGKEWYDELCLTADEYLKAKEAGMLP